jgi:hypothetical protein
MNPGKASRLRKEQHPEAYCENPKCLWRKSSGECPKHPVKSWGEPPSPDKPEDKRAIFYGDY